MWRWISILVLLGGCAATPKPTLSIDEAAAQVDAAERAFAATMADRNLEEFERYVSEEAIFFAGANTLRGRSAVVERWSKFFDGPEAPFSWEPDLVEVLDSGTLALSTGPVRDPEGNIIGRFNSIWRLEASGWRVIFDRGSPVCN